MIRRITLLALPLLVSGTIAQAVTLSTPVLENVEIASCIVTNGGTRSAAVSVEIFDFTGDKLVPIQDGCATLSPLPPHASCVVGAPHGESMSCVVQTSSRTVRAAAAAFDGSSNLVTMVPASGS